MALLPPLLLLVLAVSTTSFTPHHPRWQLSNRRSILRRAPESRDRLSVRRKAAEDDQSRVSVDELQMRSSLDYICQDIVRQQGYVIDSDRRPPRLRQAPIVEALQEAASNIRAPFFFPGHKMGM